MLAKARALKQKQPSAPGEPQPPNEGDVNNDKSSGEPEIEEECDLSCLESVPKRKVHEFIGPVKLVFVDLEGSAYCRKIFAASFLMIVNLLIGGIMVHMFFYGILTLRNERYAYKPPWILVHIFLFYFGFQVFMPIAILCINPMYGPASVLRPLQRKSAHFANNIIAATFVAGGIVYVLFGGGFNKMFANIHTISGFLAVALAIAGIVTGPFSFINARRCVGCWNCLKSAHIFVGLPAYIASTLCYMTGIIDPFVKKEFKIVYEDVPYILMVLSCVVCIIVCVGPLYKMKTCQFNAN